jgi:hypothetical protein
LETDQPGAEHSGERLPDLGLADPRLAFEEKWAAHLQGEKDRRREAPVGEIRLRLERPLDVLHRSDVHR